MKLLLAAATLSIAVSTSTGQNGAQTSMVQIVEKEKEKTTATVVIPGQEADENSTRRAARAQKKSGAVETDLINMDMEPGMDQMPGGMQEGM